jgi:hypothetical protein
VNNDLDNDVDVSATRYDMTELNNDEERKTATLYLDKIIKTH